MNESGLAALFHSLTSRLSQQLPSFLSGCWLLFCVGFVWRVFFLVSLVVVCVWFGVGELLLTLF